MIIPDANSGNGDQTPFKNVFERPTMPDPEFWTPRELIEALSKWPQDEPIDVLVQVNPHRDHDVVLSMLDAPRPNTIKIK